LEMVDKTEETRFKINFWNFVIMKISNFDN